MSRMKDETQERIAAYFDACDATMERNPLKNGGYSERQIPYTLYGLAAAVGETPERIVELAKSGATKKRRLYSAALCRIAAYTLERALLGELTHQLALPVLAELGMLKGETAGDAVVSVSMDAEALRLSR
ncbi:MAG TPA: hypothetical protein PLM48_05675 [Clostridia bacterium]|jgi:hypothetical protein|nr:hypothetical protein [Clostridia bacterium]